VGEGGEGEVMEVFSQYYYNPGDIFLILVFSTLVSLLENPEGFERKTFRVYTQYNQKVCLVY
jgi:hypothetical protein